MSHPTTAEFYEHVQENNLNVDDVMSAEEADFLTNNPEEAGELIDTQLAHLKGAPPENIN